MLGSNIKKTGGLKHMQNILKDTKIYTDLLEKFLQTNDEKYLMKAKVMSSSFVNRNIFPEEIVRIHMKAMDSIYGETVSEYKQSLQFLLESLIAYRVANSKFEQLNTERLELKSEMQVAANMQKTLLKTEIPTYKTLDIGAISVPYRQLNGDYYHFTEGENGILNFGIADVIGKGVPAALSMSMIKYAMDIFYDESMCPPTVLRNLNHIVERNVTANIFITMLFGQYNLATNVFKFASAGHEPGFIYRKATDRYEEMEAKGIVLGVVKKAQYEEYTLEIEVGDSIILLTDGVTECKRGDRFITKQELIEVIQRFSHLSAQEQVESVYNYFEQMDDFQLKDDFTLLIIKRFV